MRLIASRRRFDRLTLNRSLVGFEPDQLLILIPKLFQSSGRLTDRVLEVLLVDLADRLVRFNVLAQGDIETYEPACAQRPEPATAGHA